MLVYEAFRFFPRKKAKKNPGNFSPENLKWLIMSLIKKSNIF